MIRCTHVAVLITVAETTLNNDLETAEVVISVSPVMGVADMSLSWPQQHG